MPIHAAKVPTWCFSCSCCTRVWCARSCAANAAARRRRRSSCRATESSGGAAEEEEEEDEEEDEDGSDEAEIGWATGGRIPLTESKWSTLRDCDHKMINIHNSEEIGQNTKQYVK